MVYKLLKEPQEIRKLVFKIKPEQVSKLRLYTLIKISKFQMGEISLSS